MSPDPQFNKHVALDHRRIPLSSAITLELERVEDEERHERQGQQHGDHQEAQPSGEPRHAAPPKSSVQLAALAAAHVLDRKGA